MIRNKLWVATLLGTLGIAGVAQAGPEPDEGPGPMLRQGSANVQQMLDRRSEIFAGADANGDGQLDADELGTAMSRLRADRHVRRFDANGDGRVSEDEFNSPARRRLAFMDRNGDGRITADEMRRGGHERDDHHRKDRDRREDEEDGGW